MNVSTKGREQPVEERNSALELPSESPPLGCSDNNKLTEQTCYGSISESDAPRAAQESDSPIVADDISDANSVGSRRRSSAGSRRRSSVGSRRGSSRESFRLSVVHLENQEGLGRFTCTSIVINYMMASYLLLPYAFSQAGTLLSSICFTFTTLQSYITATFVLEACARAEGLQNVTILPENSRHGVRHGFPARYSYAIRHRTYELSELCRIFLGRHLRNFFTLTTACDLYGISWAFASVFGSTIADRVSFGTNDDYKISVAIFMAIAVPISCVPIIDQLFIQLCFLCARMIMVVIMLITTAVAFTANKPHFGDQVGAARDVPLGSFPSLILVMQVSFFSTAFQFSVPGMAHVSSNRKTMLSIFSSAVSFIFLSNLTLSLVLSIFFGVDGMEESSNLNWLAYHGGSWDGSGSVDTGRAWWASLLSYYVVLFAAIDGVAVYPLMAISLGDILMGAVYAEKFHEVKDDWRVRTFFRLLASIPPAIGALFVKDLGAIATYAAIFTVLSYTTCPSLLHIQGHRYMTKRELPVHTYYKTHFSSIWVAYALVVLSLLLIIGVIVDSSVS